MSENLTPFSEALRQEIAFRRGPSKRGTPRQDEIAAAIHRTQPYVSARVNGEYPWTTDDLDRLAPLFGETAFSLIAAAGKRAGITPLRRRAPRVGGEEDTQRAVAKDRTSDRGEEG